MPTMRTLMGPLHQVAAGDLPADLHALMTEPLLAGVRPWRGDQWHHTRCVAVIGHGSPTAPLSLDQIRRNVCDCYDDDPHAAAASWLVHAGHDGIATLRDALQVRYAAAVLDDRHVPQSVADDADSQLRDAASDGRALTALLAGRWDPQPGHGLAPPAELQRRLPGRGLANAVESVMQLVAGGTRVDDAVALTAAAFDRPGAHEAIAEATAWSVERMTPSPSRQRSWLLDFDARPYRYARGLVDERWDSAARRVLLEVVADATAGDLACSVHRLDRAVVDWLAPGSDVTVAHADAGPELAAVAVALWSTDRSGVYHRLPACFQAARRLTATGA